MNWWWCRSHHVVVEVVKNERESNSKNTHYSVEQRKENILTVY